MHMGALRRDLSRGLFPRVCFPGVCLPGGVLPRALFRRFVCQAVSQGVRFPESRIGLLSPSGRVDVRRDAHARIHGVAPAKRYLPRDTN